MQTEKELLIGKVAVKATMLQAHLNWAKTRLANDLTKLMANLDEQTAAIINRSILATDWIPLRSVIQIDRAIAQTVGEELIQVSRELGRHSARLNLGGIYKRFIAGEPHRFFERMAILHEQFQNFGSCDYEKVKDCAGKVKLQDYTEYSPVYCAGSFGYLEEALRLMKAPGPIIVVETMCQCRGHQMCLYEMTW
ncbi:MAG: hypothetical protein AB1489_32145 [Acidobacteriota bacterium]